MRTCYRLQLFLFCCYDQETPVLRLSHCRVVHLFTCSLIESQVSPIKSTPSVPRSGIPVFSRMRNSLHTTLLNAYGGAGGSRTRVLNSFLSASYNHTITHYPCWVLPVTRGRCAAVTPHICIKWRVVCYSIEY